MTEFYAEMTQKIKAQEVYADKIVVPGEGNSASPKLVFIGEAPGAEEERQRRPFVGTAGANLDAILMTLGYARSDVFITNLVKVRPTRQNQRSKRLSNRPPTRKEAEFFAIFLHEELALLRPSFVVTLGNFALNALLGNTSATIGEMHGRPIRAVFDLFPMYHPAAMIYNRKLREVIEEDVLALRRLLN